MSQETLVPTEPQANITAAIASAAAMPATNEIPAVSIAGAAALPAATTTPAAAVAGAATLTATTDPATATVAGAVAATTTTEAPANSIVNMATTASTDELLNNLKGNARVVMENDKAIAVWAPGDVTLTLTPEQIGQPELKLTPDQIMKVGEQIEKAKLSSDNIAIPISTQQPAVATATCTAECSPAAHIVTADSASVTSPITIATTQLGAALPKAEAPELAAAGAAANSR